MSWFNWWKPKPVSGPTPAGLGCLKDPPDARDYKAPVMLAPALEPLPPYVEMRQFAPKVRNQGSLGSCVAFACASLREFIFTKQVETLAGDVELPHLSPLYLYYKARQEAGLPVDKDTGTYIRAGVAAMAKQGVSPEAQWPYKIEKFSQAPTEYAEAKAHRFKIYTYHRVEGLAEMKLALAQEFGLVMALKVFDNVHGGLMPIQLKDGKWPMPLSGSRLVGWHALFFCGYQEDSTAPGGGWLIGQNSWGDWWGLKGFFFLPYQYIAEGHSDDCWCCIA